jgi:hypothetical protein
MSNIQIGINADTSAIIQDLVLKGDLGKMDEQTKVSYYNHLCQSLSLNPLTRPFEIIRLQGREVMYATKSCTEQLRKLHNLSCKIVKSEVIQSVYSVTVEISDNKRFDTSTGVVNIEGLKGDALANALMKAETKAKRRATLSICGLGILDESEIETIPNAQKVVRIEDAIDEMQCAESLEDLQAIWKKHKQFQKNAKFLEIKDYMKESLTSVETLEHE